MMANDQLVYILAAASISYLNNNSGKTSQPAFYAVRNEVCPIDQEIGPGPLSRINSHFKQQDLHVLLHEDS